MHAIVAAVATRCAKAAALSASHHHPHHEQNTRDLNDNQRIDTDGRSSV